MLSTSTKIVICAPQGFRPSQRWQRRVVGSSSWVARETNCVQESKSRCACGESGATVLSGIRTCRRSMLQELIMPIAVNGTVSGI